MANWIEQFPSFLLVFVRVTSFFIVLPLFSYRTIPTTLKLDLDSFYLGLCFYSMDAPVFEIDAAYYLLILKEALVGILIGFIAYVIMSSIQIAGGFIDFQMGFGWQMSLIHKQEHKVH